MKKPPLAPFVEALLHSSAPPWQGVRSRIIARWLGVSLQVLANWRVRDVGPTSVKAPKGVGNKMLYRPDVVAAWLSGAEAEPWEFAADWLARRGMQPTSRSEAETRKLVAQLEELGVFEAT